MSVIADIAPVVADDRLAKRNALVLAVAQALAGGNNTVIAATAGIVGTMLASDPGLATLPVSVMVLRHLARHAAARLSGAELRPPLCACRPARCSERWPGSSPASRCCRARSCCFWSAPSAAAFYAAAHNSYRFAACDTASDDYQAEGDLVRAGRRRDGRRHRPGSRHRHQGLVAAASVRRDLHRAIGAGGARGPRADAAQVAAADAARGAQAQPRPAAVGDRAAAAVHRRGRLRRRQLRHHEPGDDLGADRHGRLRPFGDDIDARHPVACARHVCAELHHRLADRAVRRVPDHRARAGAAAGQRRDQHGRPVGRAISGSGWRCSASAGISPSSAPPPW